jgi:hypothetical protein
LASQHSIIVMWWYILVNKYRYYTDLRRNTMLRPQDILLWGLTTYYEALRHTTRSLTTYYYEASRHTTMRPYDILLWDLKTHYYEALRHTTMRPYDIYYETLRHTTTRPQDILLWGLETNYYAALRRIGMRPKRVLVWGFKSEMPNLRRAWALTTTITLTTTIRS